jgi:DNA-binding MarR family transcriptional regulator
MKRRDVDREMERLSRSERASRIGVTARKGTAMAERPGPTEASAPSGVLEDQVLEDGVFRLENWLPFEFSFVANRVSSMLARMYQERYGLSVVGWRVLGVLNNESPLSAKQVSERTAMNAVNVSRAVAHLATLGMVRRGSNARDYRQVLLSPSRKGRAAYREVVPLAIAIEEELLRGMTGAQRELLVQAMGVLSRNAAARLPESRDWTSLLGKTKPGT